MIYAHYCHSLQNEILYNENIRKWTCSYRDRKNKVWRQWNLMSIQDSQEVWDARDKNVQRENSVV